eukprot:7991556-Pyramimonas_sp.AAC.1
MRARRVTAKAFYHTSHVLALQMAHIITHTHTTTPPPATSAYIAPNIANILDIHLIILITVLPVGILVITLPTIPISSCRGGGWLRRRQR